VQKLAKRPQFAKVLHKTFIDYRHLFMDHGVYSHNFVLFSACLSQQTKKVMLETCNVDYLQVVASILIILAGFVLSEPNVVGTLALQPLKMQT